MTVSDMPLKTRVYTLLLVLITAAAFAIVFRREYQISATNLALIAGILLVMTLIAEVLDVVSFPQGGQTFTVSVSAAFCFAAGLTAGPLLGGLVGALAYAIDGIIVKPRRQPIKTIVNSAMMGLSTIVSAALYYELADLEQSTIGSFQNLLTAVLAAVVYTFINTGSLALIVAPVMGVGPVAMWRINTAGLHVELLTVATLGSLIPVLISNNPFSAILLVVPLLLGPQRAFKGIKQAHHETRVAMEGLADALERRDAYTYRHSIRVTEHVRTILGAMPNIPRPTAEAIIAAAHVHDLGKVGSRDGSLKKPGELSDEERREIQQHAAIGAEIVSRLEAYKLSVDTIRHHHERWDGTGYPDGLEGERIPLGARIIAVADAFDAMTSDRVYRAALPVDVAFAELAKGRGTQFDPQIVDLFQTAYQNRVVNPGSQAIGEPLPGAPERTQRDDETPMLDQQHRQSGRQRLSVQTVSTNDHFSALFHGSRDAVLVIDQTGRCIDANPAAEALLGFERDELLQCDLSDVVVGDLEEGQFQGTPFLTGDRCPGELQVRGKDGFLRRVEAWSVEVSAAPGAASALFLRSAGEHPATDEDGARLFAIVASSTEAIIGTTLDGTITHWNPAAERLYGYRADHVARVPDSSPRCERPSDVID